MGLTFVQRRWRHATEWLGLLKQAHPGQDIGDQPTPEMIRDAGIMAIGEMLDELLERTKP
jgi:hypothetical protein